MLTGVRDDEGAFGSCLDMFTYTVRDVEVRRFQVADIGPLSDLNLDGVTDAADLAVVLTNIGRTGDLEVEDGDANADGSVNSLDTEVVLQGMPE